MSDRIKPQAQKILERSYEEEIDPVKTLLKAIESKSVLCFSITTSGMACAPVDSTVYVAIDFNPVE